MCNWPKAMPPPHSSSYRKALAIIQRAADVDPSNATWQRDVAISYGKLAAALGKAGETEQALDALRRGKAVVERMAELFPDNAGWKRDVDWFQARIAELMPAAPEIAPIAGQHCV